MNHPNLISNSREAVGEVAAEMPARDPDTGEILTYTPGYVPQKIGMLVVCLLLIFAAATQLVPALRLVAFGTFTRAEALHIVKTRDGAPDEILTKDAQWKGNEGTQDRTVTYWNVYRLHLPNGGSVNVQAAVGSFMKPAQPLLDVDGLPNLVPVYYDATDPQRFILPAEFSTWFFPGTLALFGTLGVVASGMLLYHARTPIVLPHIADARAPADSKAANSP